MKCSFMASSAHSGKNMFSLAPPPLSLGYMLSTYVDFIYCVGVKLYALKHAAENMTWLTLPPLGFACENTGLRDSQRSARSS